VQYPMHFYIMDPQIGNEKNAFQTWWFTLVTKNRL